MTNKFTATKNAAYHKLQPANYCQPWVQAVADQAGLVINEIAHKMPEAD